MPPTSVGITTRIHSLLDMEAVDACLVDTNILLRLSRLDDPNYRPIQEAIADLVGKQAELFYSIQNIAEFWSVSTRPTSRNGYGLSPDETNAAVTFIEQTMSLLPETDRVYSAWRTLVVHHHVSGVQVHDARLAALMQVHGVRHLLTLNGRDFARYPAIRIIDPLHFSRK